MNIGKFKDSIKNGVKFIKIFGNYKTKGVKFNDLSLEFKNVIHSNDYKLIYSTALKNFDYDILLADDSFFQFSFIGDSDLPRLRYAFFQNPMEWKSYNDFLSEIDFTLDEVNDKFMEEYQQYLSEMHINKKSTCLRYDLSLLQYKPNIHSVSHLHLGNIDNVRIPIDKIMTPLQFIIFVSKIVYYTEWENKVGSRNSIFMNFVDNNKKKM